MYQVVLDYSTPQAIRKAEREVKKLYLNFNIVRVTAYGCDKILVRAC